MIWGLSKNKGLEGTVNYLEMDAEPSEIISSFFPPRTNFNFNNLCQLETAFLFVIADTKMETTDTTADERNRGDGVRPDLRQSHRLIPECKAEVSIILEQRWTRSAEYSTKR